MLQPTNVATPFTGVIGFAPVQVRAAPAGLDGCVIASVTPLALPTTVLPPASRIAIAGWVENAIPPVAALGCVTNASCVAAPTVIAKVLLVDEVGPELTVAESV